jgi:hypothetical protein
MKQNQLIGTKQEQRNSTSKSGKILKTDVVTFLSVYEETHTCYFMEGLDGGNCHSNQNSYSCSQKVEWFIMFVVFINVISFILSTEPDLRTPVTLKLFKAIESTSVAIFTIEYALRLWCAAEKKKYRHKHEWLGRLR